MEYNRFERIKSMASGLDHSFIKRIYPICALVTLVAGVYSFNLYGHAVAVGVLAGGAFAIGNTMLISHVIKTTIKPGKIEQIEVWVTLFLKFPLAFGILTLVLWKGWINGAGFAVGFTTLPVSMLLALLTHNYIKPAVELKTEEVI